MTYCTSKIYKPSVLIAGATGTVGSQVARALTSRRNEFNNLGFLARVDDPKYHDLKENGFEIEFRDKGASAIKGKYNILFISVNNSALSEQNALFQLALDSGIRTVYPSEFGFDYEGVDESISGGAEFFRTKIEFRDKLRDLNSRDKLDYVLVVTNAFFDYGWQWHFWGYNIHRKEVLVFDGGELPVSWTYLPDMGQLIVASFLDKNVRNTKINVTSITATQQQIISELERACGSVWKKIETTAAAYGQEAKILGERGEISAAHQQTLTANLYSKVLAEKLSTLEPFRPEGVAIKSLRDVVADVVSRTWPLETFASS